MSCPTVALRLSEPLLSMPGGGGVFIGDEDADVDAEVREGSSSTPRKQNSGVAGDGLLTDTGMGTSPSIRDSLRVLRRSFIFSLGSRPSVKGMGRIGCSCLRWSDAGSGGLRGERKEEREGDGVYDSRERSERAAALSFEEGSPSARERGRGGMERLSEKPLLLRFFVDDTIAGA